MPNTLYFTNPDYFDLVRYRMESKTSLDCFKQCHRLLKKYSSIGNCLDVGCAPGYLYFHLSDLFGHYHGVDSSARFIEYGREQFSKEQVGNAHQMMQLTDKVIVIRALFAEETRYRSVPENPGSRSGSITISIRHWKLTNLPTCTGGRKLGMR